MKPGMRRPAVRRRLLILLAMMVWVFLVLYPNPGALVVSVRRLIRPPVDTTAVTALAATLPDDQAAVEAFSQEYVEYRPAWKLYGTPWYFPTVQQVLADRAGDCQAEALLTASILEAKKLPYTWRYSFDHVWIDYPGKVVTSLEDPRTAFVSNEGKGWLASLPLKLPVRDIVDQRVSFHWSPMPAERKVALVIGLLALLAAGEGVLQSGFRLGRRAGTAPNA